jgi:outer membrane protein assembly factor BamB
MTQTTRFLSALAVTAALTIIAASVTVPAAPPDADQFWHRWRGPLDTGEAPHATPPLSWSDTANVRWKADVPGLGKSTPIVWGDLVVLTTAVPSGGAAAPAGAPSADLTYDWVVIAYDRGNGSVRWRRAVHTGRPHEGTHRDGTFASGSAVTDGTRIYAFFGSRGLFALDMKGAVLWEQQLGRMQTRMGFGEGASPALHGNTLVVNWDHEGDDFIAAFETATGRERWRQSRDEPTTWGTPHVTVHGGRAQVIVPGSNSVSSYDLETGKPVWQAPGLTLNVIPSPVSADGMVYATSGFRGNALRAVRLADARGTVADGAGLAWSYDRDTPYVPSPLLYRGGLYFLKSNSGILTKLDAKTGTPSYAQQRLDAVPNVYASPVAADGRIYIVGREGTTVVLAAGPELKVLATNTLDDHFDASPALVDREIYLRGQKRLYRISE